MVPISHAGSATAFKADVEGAHSSPLTSEMFSVMKPPTAPARLDPERRASGIYCADESDGEALRVCEQLTEALYAFEVGGTKAIRHSPPSASPTPISRRGPARCATASPSRTAPRLTPPTSCSATRSSGTTSTPAQGRDGSFTYFPSLWGGFLNAPAE